MLIKLFVSFMLIIAIIAGVLGSSLRPDQMIIFIPVHDFVENILPILGVGALVKYLCTFPE